MLKKTYHQFSARAVAAGVAAMVSCGSWMSPPGAAATSAATIQPQLLPTNIAGTRVYPSPPAGLNPLTASDQQLAAYGFPPRPKSGQGSTAYAHWALVISHAKNAVTNRSSSHTPMSGMVAPPG